MFSHFLQKQGLGRTANKVIPVFLGLGISFIITIFTVMLIFSPVIDTHTDDASISSKTFLASSATYDYILEDGSDVSVTVFKSDYEFIINRYMIRMAGYILNMIIVLFQFLPNQN